MLEIELNESLRRRREELQTKLESLGEAEAGSFNPADLDNRIRELKMLNASIADLQKKASGTSWFHLQGSHSRWATNIESEKENDKLNAKLTELRTTLEKAQNEQAEDSRGISRQQKNTERYIAKKQMLMNRKDECNRNIRDLGVLPEEAFEKYTNEKLDKVSIESSI